jgi:hypothetical protein
MSTIVTAMRVPVPGRADDDDIRWKIFLRERYRYDQSARKPLSDKSIYWLASLRNGLCNFVQLRKRRELVRRSIAQHVEPGSRAVAYAAKLRGHRFEYTSISRFR